MNTSRLCLHLIRPYCRIHRCSSVSSGRLLACMRWRQPTLTSHTYSTETLSPPVAEKDEKTYSDKIHNLVSDISQLTLIEVSDLNDLLKKTLKITDTPMMAMGAAAGPAAAAPVDEEPEEDVKKGLVTIRLTGFDAAKKVALIKEIKSLMPNMNLVQAKKFVESTPQTIKEDLQKEEADVLQKALEAAGGQVSAD